MEIKTLPVGQIEANCYIVTDEATGHCAVIDPGDESNAILDYIESNGLKAQYIFLTHGHFDHTTAAKEVSAATGAPVYIHEKDTSQSPESYRFLTDDAVRYYKEGDEIEVSALLFTVLETPGHSPGSVTLRCGSCLFTGDTLFRDSCGRTDLPGGNMQVLMGSLRRLAALEGDLEVYPGHMDSSTLDRERRFNYYMKYAVETPG